MLIVNITKNLILIIIFFLLKKYSNTKIALRETYLLQFKREDSKKVWVVYDH